MVSRLGTEGYHGKGAITNCLKLCGMGPLLSGSNVEFKCDNRVVDWFNKGFLKVF